MLALRQFGHDLNIIAVIGIILLIDIVKKNGIMIVDFALESASTGASTNAASLASGTPTSGLATSTCASPSSNNAGGSGGSGSQSGGQEQASSSATPTPVPLGAFSHFELKPSPLTVAHQGQFPVVTVLGVLYESYIHPVTIRQGQLWSTGQVDYRTDVRSGDCNSRLAVPCHGGPGNAAVSSQRMKSPRIPCSETGSSVQSPLPGICGEPVTLGPGPARSNESEVVADSILNS